MDSHVSTYVFFLITLDLHPVFPLRFFLLPVYPLEIAKLHICSPILFGYDD